jgi:hypothetical protein
MSEMDNIPQVKAALAQFKLEFDSAMGKAADEISKQLAGTAMRQIQDDRKNVPYPAVSGKPPMNVSGDLRRSIRGQSTRKGFGVYQAEAGAYMVYARAVEFGGAPTWTNGQNFPYMRPALEQFKQTDIIRRTIAKNLRRIT